MMKRIQNSEFRIQNFLFALYAVFCLPSTALPQFLGYAAGQTVTQSFSVAAGTPTPQTIITLPNYGQVGHSVQALWTAGGGCTLLLEGSSNGAQYVVLLANPETPNLVTHVAFANGYFPFLRIRVNPGTAACTGGVTGNYTGFQMPMPSANVSKTFDRYNVGAPQRLNADVAAVSPHAISGFQCYNETGATAYIQIADASGLPLLGNAVIYQVPILNNTAFNYPGGAGFMVYNISWIGASTALGGAVAVAAGLTCNVQVNYYGPFYPFGSQ